MVASLKFQIRDSRGSKILDLEGSFNKYPIPSF